MEVYIVKRNNVIDKGFLKYKRAKQYATRLNNLEKKKLLSIRQYYGVNYVKIIGGE